MSKEFLLSVVATARNDNHGENFLYRMQHFVTGFIEQCKRHNLEAELIIVEWNPPEENEPLYKALHFPQDIGPCEVRFIRVPSGVHNALKHSDKLPLFQMIAKNVGIRRAFGKFVLATNIDILFSDSLMEYLQKHLKTNHLYRVDRLDIPSQLPTTQHIGELMQFCKTNYFRINGKYGTKVKIGGRWKRTKRCNIKILKFDKINKLKKATPFKIAKWICQVSYSIISGVIKRYWFLSVRILKKIKYNLLIKAHTNACGDFTLLSSNDWHKLQGYPEWEMYSWHIDSVLLYQARQAGIKEIDLPRSRAIYHIEHGVGSGYTHEVADALFDRLKAKGIPYLSDTDLETIKTAARTNKTQLRYNSDNWGMAHHTFEEVRIQ